MAVVGKIPGLHRLWSVLAILALHILGKHFLDGSHFLEGCGFVGVNQVVQQSIDPSYITSHAMFQHIVGISLKA